jgi:nuclear pore complex protein Nup155
LVISPTTVLAQIPPFNDQANVQIVSSDISVLLFDWLEAAERQQMSIAKSEFPVGRIDAAVDQYLTELEPARVETRQLYETVKRRLRKNW